LAASWFEFELVKWYVCLWRVWFDRISIFVETASILYPLYIRPLLGRVRAVGIARHDSNPVMWIMRINILFTTTLLGRFDNPVMRNA